MLIFRIKSNGIYINEETLIGLKFDISAHHFPFSPMDNSKNN